MILHEGTTAFFLSPCIVCRADVEFLRLVEINNSENEKIGFPAPLCRKCAMLSKKVIAKALDELRVLTEDDL